MFFILAAATAAGWLALWAVLAVRPSSNPAHGVAPPAGAPVSGPESPAVVSLLAGRLSTLDYPATLLDLAARGWFRLEPRPDGQVRQAHRLASASGSVPGWNRTGGASAPTRPERWIARYPPMMSARVIPVAAVLSRSS